MEQSIQNKFKIEGKLCLVSKESLTVAWFTTDNSLFCTNYLNNHVLKMQPLVFEPRNLEIPDLHILHKDINAKRYPWLRDEQKDIDIWAGCTATEFIGAIYEAGGEIYWPISRIKNFTLETE